VKKREQGIELDGKEQDLLSPEREQERRDIPQIQLEPELKPLNDPILIELHKTSTHWLLLEQTLNPVRKEVKVKQAFYLLWLANMTEMGPGAWDPAYV